MKMYKVVPQTKRGNYLVQILFNKKLTFKPPNLT